MQKMEKIYEVFIDSFAGASGGIISQLLFYPLENIRTRFQAQELSSQNLKAAYAEEAEAKKSATADQQRVQRKSFISKLLEMMRKDGLMSFYKGLSVALVGTVASFGGYFFFYRMLKNIVLHTFKM